MKFLLYKLEAFDFPVFVVKLGFVHFEN